ncbi:MAG: phage portal protein [Acidaminococcaceae bacterium]|nr:phage portal protein [Acidaminococcaceae bacterium]
MGFFTRIKNMIKDRNPTETVVKLVRESGNGVYTWSGELLDSGDVRAMVRPFTQAAGKFDAKHIRETVEKDGKTDIKVNPEPYIRILLAEPNPIMTGGAFRQRLAWQYMLKNNAFAYIVRDANGFAIQMYPLEWTSVEALLDENRQLYLRFNLQTGKQAVISYEDVIHIPRDVGGNELFGRPNQKALETLMEVAEASDRSIIQAVKNGGAIKWLLKYTRGMKPEDLRTRAKEFAKSFLDTENTEDGSIGVAVTGADAEAKQVEPHDYVPNAMVMSAVNKRLMAYFGTNEKIINSSYTEDEWNAYFENVIEPFAQAMAEEFTRKLFSRWERNRGNRITMDSTSLQYASMASKINLVQMVDRGALTPNEWRQILNLSPIEGGDKPIRRLDTQPVKEGGKK